MKGRVNHAYLRGHISKSIVWVMGNAVKILAFREVHEAAFEELIFV